MTTLTTFQVAQLIDHAVLKPEMTYQEKAAEILHASQLGAFSVCVNPKDIEFTVQTLSEREDLAYSAEVCAVIGFPNSAGDLRQKLIETSTALDIGANEIDYVLDMSAVKSGDYAYIEKEANSILFAVQSELGDNAVCKAIYETAYMTDKEIHNVSKIMVEVGMPFIKTSTGFAHEGATERSVSIMCEYINETTQVKASGGVRDMETLMKFYDMGVRRFGTSNTETILAGGTASSNY